MGCGGERRSAVEEKREELVRVLNEVLSAEYGALWLLPRHMAEVQDEELRRQLHLIAEVELEHAEMSLAMIHQLGGRATADLPQLTARSDLREVLEAHVEGERQSIAIYERAMGLADDPELRKALAQMKAEEEGHLRLLERALERL